MNRISLTFKDLSDASVDVVKHHAQFTLTIRSVAITLSSCEPLKVVILNDVEDFSCLYVFEFGDEVDAVIQLTNLINAATLYYYKTTVVQITLKHGC